MVSSGRSFITSPTQIDPLHLLSNSDTLLLGLRLSNGTDTFSSFGHSSCELPERCFAWKLATLFTNTLDELECDPNSYRQQQIHKIVAIKTDLS